MVDRFVWIRPVVHVDPFVVRGVAVVAVCGSMDVGWAPQLAEAIGMAIDRGGRRLVIDLTEATMLDCASLGEIQRAMCPLRADPEALVVLAGAAGVVERLLDLLGIDGLFPVIPSREVAVSVLRSGLHAPTSAWRTPSPRDGARFALHEARAARNLSRPPQASGPAR
jgi:anti-anti-sigma factor